MVTIAVVMGLLAIITGQALGYPLRDPEGFLGPAWVRLPLLCLGAFIADVVPRTLWRSRGRLSRFRTEARLLIREHWTRERITLVVLGLVCFYVTYVSYRNLKNFLPFVRGGQTRQGDYELHKFDQWLMFGNDPAIVLHNLLGTTVSAHVLSWVYLIFLPMVPISVTIWLVWSRNVSFGYWYVTAQCICWTLGTASYYMIPTLGPNFAFPWLYSELDPTGVTELQDALYYGRQNVRFDPFADGRAVGGRVRVPARRRDLADGAGRAVHRPAPVHQDRAVEPTRGSRCSRRRTSAGTTSPTTSPARSSRSSPSTSAASRPGRSSTNTGDIRTPRPRPATCPVDAEESPTEA